MTQETILNVARQQGQVFEQPARDPVGAILQRARAQALDVLTRVYAWTEAAQQAAALQQQVAALGPEIQQLRDELVEQQSKVNRLEAEYRPMLSTDTTRMKPRERHVFTFDRQQALDDWRSAQNERDRIGHALRALELDAEQMCYQIRQLEAIQCPSRDELEPLHKLLCTEE